MEKVLFDVYDKKGNLVIADMTNKEIAAALNTQCSNVSKRASDGGFIGGKYKIVRKNDREKREKIPEATVRELLMTKWADAVKPFKNVIWVDKYEPGVKRLRRV